MQKWNDFEIWCIQRFGKQYAFFATRAVIVLAALILLALATSATWLKPIGWFIDNEPVGITEEFFIRILIGVILIVVGVMCVLGVLGAKEFANFLWESFNNKYPDQEKKDETGEEVNDNNKDAELENRVMQELMYWQAELDKIDVSRNRPNQ